MLSFSRVVILVNGASLFPVMFIVRLCLLSIVVMCYLFMFFLCHLHIISHVHFFLLLFFCRLFLVLLVLMSFFFFFSSRRRHTRCALVTGVQTCALPISFYLLASKSGWNTETAFQAFARANRDYWTASTDFDQGACGVEQAATDLGFSEADVASAFSSVGVSCDGNTDPDPDPGSGELTRGVPETGLSGSSGQSLNFTLDVPSGASNLVFTMSGGSGDADLYVKFGSAPTDSSWDCRPYRSGNNESCSFSSPSTGTYHVRIKGYSAFSGVSIVGDYDTGGGGGDVQTYSNSGDYAINNNATVYSPITVSGRSGDASTSTSVSVDIKHTYIGDLKVDLVAPDGSVYGLHNRSGGSADNIIKTYTGDLSVESLNGTWRLRVTDYAWGDTRSEEHTSELQSLMSISYAVICLEKKTRKQKH